ncbi:hypothetical protein IV102_00680 [bacterium]|nr:hypothetical protein [bacterium]
MKIAYHGGIVLLLLSFSAWPQTPPGEIIPTSQIESVRQQHDPLFLDVRTAEEIRTLGTLPGYTNIPIDELEKRLDELPKGRPILTA